MGKKKFKIRFGIGTKLKGLIGILLLSSIASVVWLSTQMFIEDNTALIQQINVDTATNLSIQVRQQLQSSTEKMRFFGTLVFSNQNPKENGKALTNNLFETEGGFLALYLLRHRDNDVYKISAKLISEQMKSMGDATGTKNVSLVKKSLPLQNLVHGEVQISTLKILDDSPAIILGIPFINHPGKPNTYSHSLLAIIPYETIQIIFSENDLITSYLLDRQGYAIAHPNAAFINQKRSLAHLEIVKKLLTGKFSNGQTRYVDPQTQKAYLVAFRTVGFGSLGVIAEVPEAKAFEAAHRLEYRAALFGIVILCLALLAGHLYSNSIIWPIYDLAAAASKISKGIFNIGLKPKARDEIGYLSLAFKQMAHGLEERDQVKNIFQRFHNKEVAEKLLSGEVELGGESREATIFFSDIRNFTQMSESMEPSQVVEMLNEYMDEMVNVISRYGGIVDKYIGDSIMAIWGVPVSETDDTYCAVHACLEMRQRLVDLNERRRGRGELELKIGIGLNRGNVTAGNIGTTERMEYTVIGDSVNLAARMQSLTKQYGTDVLISKSVVDKVPNQFILEECASVSVRGKSEPVEIYKILGYIAHDGQRIQIPPPQYTPQNPTDDSQSDGKKAA